ncbi:MAG: radical SAM protein [Syntrophus sp. (in: bacteria)]
MAKILMIQLQSIPYCGTAYLNSAVKSRGHEFCLYLHLGKKNEKVLQKIDEIRPEIIGFSSMTGFHADALSLSREIKKRYKQPVIMGGAHPTLFPDVIHEEGLDIICLGEGEFALIELMDAIEHKRSYRDIKNLWVKENGKVYKNPLRFLVDPLDEVPLIDWSCYAGTPIQNSSAVAFVIRGCPYSCSYCFNDSVKKMYKGLGDYVRYFSVERAIKEVEQSLKVLKQDSVLFLSDTFGINSEWMEQFLSAYAQKINLPYVILLRPELATKKNIEILGMYRCNTVGIGVESGSERVRKEILHRNYSNHRLLDIAENLHRNNIKIRTYNMIGLPGESEEEMWETLQLNIDMKAEYPRGAIFMPFPNTRIVEYAKTMGYLDSDFSFNSIPNSILSHSILRNINANRIKNYLYFFQSIILFPGLKNFFRLLIKQEPNILFRLWFYMVYAHIQRKSESRGLISYIKFVISNIGKI